MNNRKCNNYYLDACATTPPLEEVTKEISRINNQFWGNSSSIHSHGIRSATIIEQSRNLIARKLNLSCQQIIFSRGATHSNHLAISELIATLSPGKIVISSVEHPSIYNSLLDINSKLWTIEYWKVDKTGVIDLNLIDHYLTAETKFLSLIWGQSEIGSIQPIKLISKLCQERNICLHIDATQVFSQGILDLKGLYFDFISLSAHKFQGPIGVGLLLINSKYPNKFNNKGADTPLVRYLQNQGTQPVALIAGMAKAITNLTNKIIISDLETYFIDDYVSKITKALLNLLLKIDGVELIGDPKRRLPHHISLLINNETPNKYFPANEFVRLLSDKGVSIGSGTACNLKSNQESYVLKAIGLRKEYRHSVVRITLGSWVQEEDISEIITIIDQSIQFIRKTNN